MTIVHVTPTYFSDDSVIGGGERFAQELAKHMAKEVSTKLVSFSRRRESLELEGLRVEVFPRRRGWRGTNLSSWSTGFIRELRDADVIHCHQCFTMTTDVSIIAAKLMGKRVFVIDHGGGDPWTISRFFDVLRFADGIFSHSSFAAPLHNGFPKEKLFIIPAGVDCQKFCPCGSTRRERKVLFVGRILSHKGINYLVESVKLLSDTSVELRIVGRVYDQRFMDDLRRLAAGINVTFIGDASDEQLVDEYRSSLVTVLPSVYVDMYGDFCAVPELKGLVLMESMGCGTPVICTDVGGMPEFVEDGVVGFVVPPNNPSELAERVRLLGDSPAMVERMGFAGRRVAVERFGWAGVVKKCLQVYEERRA